MTFIEKAAAAYHAGKYRSMKAAMKAMSKKGGVKSNPRKASKKAKSSPRKRASAAQIAHRKAFAKAAKAGKIRKGRRF